MKTKTNPTNPDNLRQKGISNRLSLILSSMQEELTHVLGRSNRFLNWGARSTFYPKRRDFIILPFSFKKIERLT